MERDTEITILYRMAEKKSKTSKVKPDWINNKNCLTNMARFKMDTKLIVFGDKLLESEDLAEELSDEYIETKQHGNAETFIEILDYAVENLNPDDIVYFCEDDYLHKEGFVNVIKDGLEHADYVSLYDHPDKYPGTNDLIVTNLTHWKRVESTTMTFATKVKTLIYDAEIFKKMCAGQVIPPDLYIFTYLTREMKRRLLTPIPAFATHGETQWLSPLIKWEEYL